MVSFWRPVNFGNCRFGNDCFFFFEMVVKSLSVLVEYVVKAEKL